MSITHIKKSFQKDKKCHCFYLRVRHGSLSTEASTNLRDSSPNYMIINGKRKNFHFELAIYLFFKVNFELIIWSAVRKTCLIDEKFRKVELHKNESCIDLYTFSPITWHGAITSPAFQNLYGVVPSRAQMRTINVYQYRLKVSTNLTRNFSQSLYGWDFNYIYIYYIWLSPKLDTIFLTFLISIWSDRFVD